MPRHASTVPAMDPFVLLSELLGEEVDPAHIRGRDLEATTPERKLLVAVITQAYADGFGRVDGVTYRPMRAKIAAEARDWLTDVTSENFCGGAALGLRFCAETLGMPAAVFGWGLENLDARAILQWHRVRASGSRRKVVQAAVASGRGRGRPGQPRVRRKAA